MTQLELPLFWPLTEQMCLDLDHTNCLPKSSGIFYTTNTGTYLMANSNILSTTKASIIKSVTISASTINVDSTIFTTSKKPNILKLALYKFMGIKLQST